MIIFWSLHVLVSGLDTNVSFTVYIKAKLVLILHANFSVKIIGDH